MLALLLEHTTRGARLAALLAVALVAGFLVASTVGAPGPARLVAVVAGDQDAATESARTERSAKPEKTGKPENTGKPDDAGNRADEQAGGEHGACVSKVAGDHSKVGGPHDNHGWAVSRAAKSCPHPAPTSTGG
jgi:hypothetical protein